MNIIRSSSEKVRYSFQMIDRSGAAHNGVSMGGSEAERPKNQEVERALYEPDHRNRPDPG
jgi:hypothetical protein